VETLAMAASSLFDVELERGLTLLTIRHYTDELLKSILEDKQVVLKQEYHQTVQVVIKVK